MEKLNTIQKTDKIHDIYRGLPGPGGASSFYRVYQSGSTTKDVVTVKLQFGARCDPNHLDGLLDEDLLEIVRDRITAFQAGEFRCLENSMALHYIEKALMWLNWRKEDRKKRGVLGTYQK